MAKIYRCVKLRPILLLFLLLSSSPASSSLSRNCNPSCFITSCSSKSNGRSCTFSPQFNGVSYAPLIFSRASNSLIDNNNNKAPCHAFMQTRLYYQSKSNRTLLDGNNNNENDDENKSNNKLLFKDPRLLFVDLSSIAIAIQLVGLLNVLSDPIFYEKGGWLQPIPIIPATLNVAIQRYSITSVIWLMSCVIAQKSMADQNSNSIISETLGIFGTFCVIRVALAVLFSFIFPDVSGNVAWDQLLLQFYILVLILPTFRYLYNKFNY